MKIKRISVKIEFMKRKVECFYFDEIYDNIINDINITTAYLNESSDINSKSQHLCKYSHIGNMKKKFDDYLYNLNHEVIYNIKHELDLFFLLMSKTASKSQSDINTDILLKLILKIDNMVLSNHKK
jgi:hypothetical protein